MKDLSFKSSDINYLNAMRKLSSESIPITSIFLSGRPLAVNKQINLSSAFIAAWLPGQAVEGIADVILKKDGKINKDFTGKLSFTWPRKSTQTVLNSNDPLSNHLFAFGYGLSYSDTCLLYTSDAADDSLRVDLGGRRIIKNNVSRIVLLIEIKYFQRDIFFRASV